jgi:hypothetical protein
MRRASRAFNVAVICFSLGVPGCALPTFPAFRNYDEQTLADQQVATIENRWGCPWCIDQLSGADGSLLYDVKKDGGMDPFKLTPGTYLVRISYQGPKIHPVSKEGTAELKAGHVYRVKNETCFGGPVLGLGACHGRQAYTATVWIEDIGTGEVVVGEKWE